MQRYQRQLQALGSDIFITFVSVAGKGYVDDLFSWVIQLINEFDMQFSRFKVTSELTKFNQKAGSKTLVSKSFYELLLASQYYSLLTSGLYNPFVLPALQRAGYLGSWPNTKKASSPIDYTKRQVTTPEALVIGDSWAQIPKDAALDFGGIGKGYLLDELSDVLRTKNLEGYWLSLGGDIICNGYDLNKKDWHIAIQSAVEPTQAAGEFLNKGGQVMAVATSGVTKRRGTNNGKPWHHIIDPRTAQPAHTDVLTVSVTALTATAADVLAKCIVIDGPKVAQTYQKQGWIHSYLLQTKEQETILVKLKVEM